MTYFFFVKIKEIFHALILIHLIFLYLFMINRTLEYCTLLHVFSFQSILSWDFWIWAPHKILHDYGLPLRILEIGCSFSLIPNWSCRSWVTGSVQGSDILLEAILEAEIAHNAKDFFSQPQNQIVMNKEVTYPTHCIA